MNEPYDPYDDWFDDDLSPAKEEPDCGGCMDSGGPCRDCNPTRLQHLWWRLTWRFRWWRIRAWFRRSTGQTEESPF